MYSCRGLPNYWMVKSPGTSGGEDTVITSNLSCILRMPDTGPKVKYYNSLQFEVNFGCEDIVWRNGDILEQQANNRSLFKRYSKLLYTITQYRIQDGQRGGPRNMKYKGPPVAAIFFMTSFNRGRGGHGPPSPPPGSAADY